MLKRYMRIRDALLSVADSLESSLHLNRSTAFKTKAAIYSSQFEEINVVTTELQKRGLNRSDSIFLLDDLIDAVESGRDDMSFPFFHCVLVRLTYQELRLQSCRRNSFEPGVIKIQKTKYSELTDQEKRRANASRHVCRVFNRHCIYRSTFND